MLDNVKARVLGEVVKERDKYVTKSEPSTKKGDELVQATAATVGFVSEIIHHRKEKKATRKPPKTHDPLGANATEVPVSSQTPEDGASTITPSPKDLAAAFLARSPPSISSPLPSFPVLETPILVPQRRPNTRARGFTPAYAPVLSSFDISQPTFLDFIITLNASLEPNPYLNAINLAGFAGEASPEPFVGLLVGLGVEVVTGMIMEAQSRAKSNGFLEKVNAEFFAPRGLFIFVGMWSPKDDQTGRDADIPVNDVQTSSQSQLKIFQTTKSVAGDRTNPVDKWRGVQEQMQRAIAPAGGKIATVTSAPLVWASAEEITAATPANMAKKKDRFDRAGIWLDDHVDKHSQVRWTQEYPDHPLAGSLPKPEFRSRYADPSHAASSGDVVALLTGGQWHSKEDEKKREKEIQKDLEKERKKEKKQKAKEEKAKLKSEKSKAKADSSGDKNLKTDTPGDGVRETDGHSGPESASERGRRETHSSDQSKRDTSKNSRESSKQRKDKKDPKHGIGSLLEDNLLYLVIVQHPSVADST